MSDLYYVDNNEYTETEITEEKKFNWNKFNKMVIGFHIICPVWGFFMIYTKISENLMLYSVLFWLVFCVVAQFFRRYKIAYNVARTIWLAFVIAGYLPAIGLMSFNDDRSMYEFKKAEFTYGVYDKYGYLLPDKLPEVCKDYSFETIGTVIAQDVGSQSHLIFYTDADTIDEYRAYYKSQGCKSFDLIQRNSSSDPYYWFCSRMGLDEKIRNDTENNEFYVTEGVYATYSPRAVLLNPKSGLVAILA